MVGAGFSFAHHFSDHDAVAAMLSYREHFRPSPGARQPHAMLALRRSAPTVTRRPSRLATTVDLNWVRRARGEYLPLASPEEAAAYPYSPSTASASSARPPAPVRWCTRDRT
jgi:hypothetical protein